MGINGKVGASCKQCDILEVPTTSGSACRLPLSVGYLLALEIWNLQLWVLIISVYCNNLIGSFYSN